MQDTSADVHCLQKSCILLSSYKGHNKLSCTDTYTHTPVDVRHLLRYMLFDLHWSDGVFGHSSIRRQLNC